jgi:hypothetical protein
MLAAPHGQRVAELAKRSQGPDGMMAGVQPFGARPRRRLDLEDWDYAFWFSPAVTLGVGTQEVLKNVVGERVLGLPREQDPSARGPWNQTHAEAKPKAEAAR